MENARRIAELEGKIDLLADALRQVTTECTAQLAAQSFAIEALLRPTRPNHLFCAQLRLSVTEFLSSSAQHPDQYFESRLLLQMNSFLEAAGEPPQTLDKEG